jgi:reactive intermediate/imine deaminase
MPVETLIGPKSRPDGTSIPLSAAVKAGGFVFLSGQLAHNPDGSYAGTDIETQARKTLENIDATLKKIGLSKSDVCKATVFLTDPKNFGAFNKAYREYFGDTPPPARSTVGCALMDPQALIEIEVLAYAGD